MTLAYHVRDRRVLTSGFRAEPEVVVCRWPGPDLCRGYWSPRSSSRSPALAPERVGLARREHRLVSAEIVGRPVVRVMVASQLRPRRCNRHDP
jgi:hypothetical protein